MSREYQKGDEPVPGYVLVHHLGSGQFGHVWKAYGNGVYVALKIVESALSDGGRREVKALQLVKNITYPTLVPLYGYWLQDENGNTLDERALDAIINNKAQNSPEPAGLFSGWGAKKSQKTRLFIAMGLGDKTLFDRLQEYRAQGQSGIPIPELLRYMKDAAEAVDYLNQRKRIQHGDIKSQNILIIEDRAYVCDYGLAQAIGDDVRQTSTGRTPGYSAPEIDSGVGAKLQSDQYSLAITYYELRTGSLPYYPEDGVSHYRLSQAKMEGRLNLSSLTPDEAKVLRRALDPDPNRRFSSCVRMQTSLERAFPNEEDTDSVFITPPTPAPLKVDRNQLLEQEQKRKAEEAKAQQEADQRAAAARLEEKRQADEQAARKQRAAKEADEARKRREEIERRKLEIARLELAQLERELEEQREREEREAEERRLQQEAAEAEQQRLRAKEEEQKRRLETEEERRKQEAADALQQRQRELERQQEELAKAERQREEQARLRRERQQQEEARQQQEREERERREAKRLEREVQEKERIEAERRERERLEQLRLQQESLERDRIRKEQEEQERIEAKRQAEERARLEKERQQKEREERERLEAERLQAERLELLRLEEEQREQERLQKEREEFELQKQEADERARREAAERDAQEQARLREEREEQKRKEATEERNDLDNETDPLRKDSTIEPSPPSGDKPLQSDDRYRGTMIDGRSESVAAVDELEESESNLKGTEVEKLADTHTSDIHRRPQKTTRTKQRGSPWSVTLASLVILAMIVGGAAYVIVNRAPPPDNGSGEENGVTSNGSKSQANSASNGTNSGVSSTANLDEQFQDHLSKQDWQSAFELGVEPAAAISDWQKRLATAIREVLESTEIELDDSDLPSQQSIGSTPVDKLVNFFSKRSEPDFAFLKYWANVNAARCAIRRQDTSGCIEKIAQLPSLRKEMLSGNASEGDDSLKRFNANCEALEVLTVTSPSKVTTQLEKLVTVAKPNYAAWRDSLAPWEQSQIQQVADEAIQAAEELIAHPPAEKLTSADDELLQLTPQISPQLLSPAIKTRLIHAVAWKDPSGALKVLEDLRNSQGKDDISPPDRLIIDRLAMTAEMHVPAAEVVRWADQFDMEKFVKLASVAPDDYYRQQLLGTFKQQLDGLRATQQLVAFKILGKWDSRGSQEQMSPILESSIESAFQPVRYDRVSQEVFSDAPSYQLIAFDCGKLKSSASTDPLLRCAELESKLETTGKLAVSDWDYFTPAAAPAGPTSAAKPHPELKEYVDYVQAITYFGAATLFDVSAVNTKTEVDSKAYLVRLATSVSAFANSPAKSWQQAPSRRKRLLVMHARCIEPHLISDDYFTNANYSVPAIDQTLQAAFLRLASQQETAASKTEQASWMNSDWKNRLATIRALLSLTDLLTQKSQPVPSDWKNVATLAEAGMSSKSNSKLGFEKAVIAASGMAHAQALTSTPDGTTLKTGLERVSQTLSPLLDQTQFKAEIDDNTLYGKFVAYTSPLIKSDAADVALKKQQALLHYVHGRLIQRTRPTGKTTNDAYLHFQKAGGLDPQLDYLLAEGRCLIDPYFKLVSTSDNSPALQAVIDRIGKNVGANGRISTEHPGIHALRGELFLMQSRKEPTSQKALAVLEQAIFEFNSAIQKSQTVVDDFLPTIYAGASQAHLEAANHSPSPVAPEIEEYLNFRKNQKVASPPQEIVGTLPWHLHKAEEYARRETEIEPRRRPEEAYWRLGNAIEDHALFDIVKKSDDTNEAKKAYLDDALQQFGRASTVFKENTAKELPPTEEHKTREGECSFNFARCSYRRASASHSSETERTENLTKGEKEISTAISLFEATQGERLAEALKFRAMINLMQGREDGLANWKLCVQKAKANKSANYVLFQSEFTRDKNWNFTDNSLVARPDVTAIGNDIEEVLKYLAANPSQANGFASQNLAGMAGMLKNPGNPSVAEREAAAKVIKRLEGIAASEPNLKDVALALQGELAIQRFSWIFVPDPQQLTQRATDLWGGLPRMFEHAKVLIDTKAEYPSAKARLSKLASVAAIFRVNLPQLNAETNIDKHLDVLKLCTASIKLTDDLQERKVQDELEFLVSKPSAELATYWKAKRETREGRILDAKIDAYILTNEKDTWSVRNLILNFAYNNPTFVPVGTKPELRRVIGPLRFYNPDRQELSDQAKKQYEALRGFVDDKL